MKIKIVCTKHVTQITEMHPDFLLLIKLPWFLIVILTT